MDTKFYKGMSPWNKGLRGYNAGEKNNMYGKHPTAWNKGKKGLQVAWNKGKKFSEEIRQKMRDAHKNNPKYQIAMKKNGLKGLIAQQNMKEPTSIEKIVYDHLLLKGILFEKQKLINGKFIVDAYIPSLNLVIEADGSYWHSLDRVKGKYKAENAYLTKCGFNLVRLSEDEINDGSFKERMVV